MRDMTVRFELFVDDTGHATEFYRDVLGFEVTAEFGAAAGSTYVELRNGDAIIGLQPAQALERGVPDGDPAVFRSPPSGVELVLEVGDVEAYRARARASGYPVVADLEDRPWGELDFRLRDPDGYYLRITSRRSPRYQRQLGAFTLHELQAELCSLESLSRAGQQPEHVADDEDRAS